MNKLMKNIVGSIVLVLILILFYLFTFQLSHDRLIIKEATSVVSITNLNSKKIDPYYALYEKATSKDIKDIKKITKYVKSIDLIYFNDPEQETNLKTKGVVAVNVGWLYPIIKFKQDKYFKNMGKNYFSLKDEYQKEINKKYGINQQIYMTNYKGYYFIADNIMELSDYMRLIVKKEVNKNITKVLEGKTVIEGAVDLEGKIDQLTAFKLDLDHEGDKFIVAGHLYGQIEFSKYLEGLDYQDRKLSKYMGKNRVYLTNKDFKQLTQFLKGNLNKDTASILSIVKMLTGRELEDYMDQIDGELVYDSMTDQLILPVKNSKYFDELLDILAKKTEKGYILNNGKTIVIEDNVIYYNGKMTEGDQMPTKEEFINGSLNLGIYNPKFMDLYINVGGTFNKKSVEIKAEIKDEEILEMYNRMEAN